jgi:hypothetical protein
LAFRGGAGRFGEGARAHERAPEAVERDKKTTTTSTHPSSSSAAALENESLAVAKLPDRHAFHDSVDSDRDRERNGQRGDEAEAASDDDDDGDCGAGGAWWDCSWWWWWWPAAGLRARGCASSMRDCGWVIGLRVARARARERARNFSERQTTKNRKTGRRTMVSRSSASFASERMVPEQEEE